MNASIYSGINKGKCKSHDVNGKENTGQQANSIASRSESNTAHIIACNFSDHTELMWENPWIRNTHLMLPVKGWKPSNNVLLRMYSSYNVLLHTPSSDGVGEHALTNQMCSKCSYFYPTHLDVKINIGSSCLMLRLQTNYENRFIWKRKSEPAQWSKC